MPRVLLLCNPSASSVTPRARVVIQAAFGAEADVTVAETSRRGHATRLAQGAAANGTDVVVVLGGDGTLNEAANGLVGSATALAALPGGSTNVFARTIGLPNDPIEATGALIEALRAGKRKRVGLGNANGRYFTFHVGAGFDAAVVEEVEKRSSLKRYAGNPLFVYAAFRTWFRGFDHKTPAFAVHHADGTIIDDGYFSICQKTDPYTYLGRRPLSLAPEATLDSGLAVTTLRSMSFATIIGAAGSAMGSGRHLRRSHRIDRRVDVDSLTLVGHRKFPYQLDGEFVGEVDRLELRYQPDCLDLVVP
ncbi:MAG TPA: diacylglycerol kinase family protein [Acidimicrobiales bacterium]|nr:diacylglycerol kinase family protein [Acidimicrobiales bacterium]